MYEEETEGDPNHPREFNHSNTEARDHGGSSFDVEEGREVWEEVEGEGEDGEGEGDAGRGGTTTGGGRGGFLIVRGGVKTMGFDIVFILMIDLFSIRGKKAGGRRHGS